MVQIPPFLADSLIPSLPHPPCAPQALRYGQISTLEQSHTSGALRLIQDADGGLFGLMAESERQEAIIFIKALIISSDMARHAAVVRDFSTLFPVRDRA